MSDSIKRTLKRIDGYRESLVNLYDNAARFHWTHDQMLAARGKMQDEPTYAKLPNWAKERLRGADDILHEQMWKKVVFSYVVKGNRLAITSGAYRKFSSQYVHEHCADTGAHVWADAPDKLFTSPKRMADVRQVIVGNIGNVYTGEDAEEARRVFNLYIGQSTSDSGRAAGENVTLLCGDTIEAEHIGQNSTADQFE